MPTFQTRNLGTIKGTGTLVKRGGEPINVAYTFSGLHNPNNGGSLETSGSIKGPPKEMREVEGNASLVLTMNDGRKVDVAVYGVKGTGEANLSVNTTLDEFKKHPRQR